MCKEEVSCIWCLIVNLHDTTREHRPALAHLYVASSSIAAYLPTYSRAILPPCNRTYKLLEVQYCIGRWIPRAAVRLTIMITQYSTVDAPKLSLWHCNIFHRVYVMQDAPLHTLFLHSPRLSIVFYSTLHNPLSIRTSRKYLL